MQEHLERFPSHKMNTAEKRVDSELQDIFQNLHETPINSNTFSIFYRQKTYFIKTLYLIIFQLI